MALYNLFMKPSDADILFIKGRIGQTRYDTFLAMFNTAQDDTIGMQMIERIYTEQAGNLNLTMVEMLSVIKDKIAGSLSILGRIKIGPIELENVISGYDQLLKELRQPTANKQVGATVFQGYTGPISFGGEW